MPPTQNVKVSTDVPASMRDGTVLRATVYSPEAPGPWPVLLARTPYSRNNPGLLAWLDPVATASKGFIVVLQDTRGRFGSEGDWVPFHAERHDGYDTIEWAARLPGANGRVGMYCASYVGNVQWMAAIEQPPSLGAIAPAETWCDPLDGLFGRGGALEWGLALVWDLQTGAGHLPRLGLSDAELGERVEVLIDDIDGLPTDGYWHLPAAEPEVLRRYQFPDIGTLAMLTNPEVPEWSRVAGRHDRVTVPSFNIAGWYDIFLQGSLDNYMAMAQLGRPTELVVGPWTHYDPFADPIGQRCFGARAGRVGVPAHPEGDLTDRQLAWFARHLDPNAAVVEEPEYPVRIFVMGQNRWRDERTWPLTRAQAEQWYLASDGSLVRGVVPDSTEPTTFVYDPADPVPTLGGQTVMVPAYPAGPFDQRPIEQRQDVCTFTSEPLTDDLEVTGRITVVLHVGSSAPSTDWVARLCDVTPDGHSYNLADGITRIHEGADRLQRVEIDLWSTSNVFLAGHRVRVQVTSSNFPRWDRNLNTGGQDQPTTVAATQTIRHDTTQPSWIELPVIPG